MTARQVRQHYPKGFRPAIVHQPGIRQLLKVANRLQVPSHLSLTTALAYHEITTRVQQRWLESISTRRSASIQAGGTTFVYYKMQRGLYFGFNS